MEVLILCVLLVIVSFLFKWYRGTVLMSGYAAVWAVRCLVGDLFSGVAEGSIMYIPVMIGTMVVFFMGQGLAVKIVDKQEKKDYWKNMEKPQEEIMYKWDNVPWIASDYNKLKKTWDK